MDRSRVGEVDRRRRGLDQKDVASPNVLIELAEILTIGKLPERDRCRLQVKVPTDFRA